MVAKYHLKSKFELFQNSLVLFPLIQFVKYYHFISWRWMLKDYIRVNKKKTKIILQKTWN